VTHGYFGERVDPLPDEIYNVEGGDAFPGPLTGSVTPSRGPAGTPVVITGKNLAVTTAVKWFDGGDPASEAGAPPFTVESDAQVTTTAAAVANLGTGTVGCYDADGVGNTVPFTYETPPPTPLTLTSAAPASGPIAGGTVVTLVGTGFQTPGWHVDDVTFAGMSAASYTVDSDTQITATTSSVATAIVDAVTVARMDDADVQWEDAQTPWEYTAA
jgi:hypothetical protein